MLHWLVVFYLGLMWVRWHLGLWIDYRKGANLRIIQIFNLSRVGHDWEILSRIVNQEEKKPALNALTCVCGTNYPELWEPFSVGRALSGCSHRTLTWRCRWLLPHHSRLRSNRSRFCGVKESEIFLPVIDCSPFRVLIKHSFLGF